MMKTKKTTTMMCCILAAMLFMASCSKDGDQGPVGPAGPQGEQGSAGLAGADGADGADGVDGEQGEQGEPGTANVIYSDWINTEFSNNIITTSSSFTIDAPQIDSDLLNFGTILVYARRVVIGGGGNLVYQLPIVFGTARQQSYYFRAQGGEIRITVAANEEGENAGDGTFLEQYRYVLIPGAVSTSGKSSIDYQKMTYEEITAHFEIED